MKRATPKAISERNDVDREEPNDAGADFISIKLELADTFCKLALESRSPERGTTASIGRTTRDGRGVQRPNQGAHEQDRDRRHRDANRRGQGVAREPGSRWKHTSQLLRKPGLFERCFTCNKWPRLLQRREILATRDCHDSAAGKKRRINPHPTSLGRAQARSKAQRVRHPPPFLRSTTISPRDDQLRRGLPVFRVWATRSWVLRSPQRLTKVSRSRSRRYCSLTS